MNNDIIRYVLEHSGGLLIAVILIVRMEAKLDGLTNEITRLIDTLTRHLILFSQNGKSEK
ncbi:hypothetical protein BBP12_08590 [Limosilactobacillus reuteri]|nr:hypothetical protein BBP12_08590 [Limosilactobacillus reuteri]OCW65739.1 hypothetical protein BBP11_04535 [Limosilactobacillus reuteri]OCW66871.1 hypothetical protein BBP10_00070 [Limosilactobacillus reuteri]OCW70974.1 hypothetical protein BBP13_03785 [Limosilactobacillus reuteri]